MVWWIMKRKNLPRFMDLAHGTVDQGCPFYLCPGVKDAVKRGCQEYRKEGRPSMDDKCLSGNLIFGGYRYF